MAALSDYAEKLLLDYLLNAEATTRPTARFLALFTSPPSDAGGGTEVSGAGYARQPIPFAPTSAPGGDTHNTAAVQFVASGGNFGKVTHAAIFDAVTGGNMLMHGALAAEKTIDDGDALSFAVGAANAILA